jgi:putative chitinase
MLHAGAASMTTLTLEHLQRLWPHGDQHVPGLMAGIVQSAPAVLEKYGVPDTPLVIAHMMGQFSEECGGGLEMVENDNFTAQQLLNLWPRHFTPSMAQRYAHNARMICDVAYGGRMGNAPPPSDDGYNYRGKGLSQLTGKENYERLAVLTGLDVIKNPDLLIDPETTFECGVADYVKICGCLPFAEKDDTINETKHLNGGLIGLSDRRLWIARWKKELGA